MSHSWLPQSLLSFKNYSWAIFKQDCIAGITVAVISIPLAMAFAIASGVRPDQGLYTAMVAGFLISALGGSRYQIGGPTGAFVVILYGIVQKTGYEGLAVSGLIAALLIFLFGVFRFGSWIRYVPHPLITGFTTGIAVIVFSSQIKDFFGLQMGPVPADFIEKWAAYFTALPTLDFVNLGLSSGTLACILLLRRFAPRVPWGVTAIIGATIIACAFHLPVETIQSKFGALPRHLPWPAFPDLTLWNEHGIELFKNALAIAFLGAVESLLSAVIADGMTGTRHLPNQELIGQGVANIASILFGGIPATGAIARTAANVKSGAQTPMAGMINGFALLGILLFLSPLVSLIPLCALSAVLIVLAWNMSELSHFVQILKAPPADVTILLVGLVFTVFIDITAAIVVGMFIASLNFMKRMGESSKMVVEPSGHEHIEIVEVHGPLFFGATDLLKNLKPSSKVFILRLGRVSHMDASGMHAIRELYKYCKKLNTPLFLTEVGEITKKDLKKFGVWDQIGESQIFATPEAAVQKASRLLH